MLVLVGAWLVLPFTGIELLAVGIAFAIYARHAVDYERIRLFQNRLLIEQMNAEAAHAVRIQSALGAESNRAQRRETG